MFLFGEIESTKDGKGKVVQKGVYCMMARDEMVRFFAGIGAKEPLKNKIQNPSKVLLKTIP